MAGPDNQNKQSPGMAPPSARDARAGQAGMDQLKTLEDASDQLPATETLSKQAGGQAISSVFVNFTIMAVDVIK